MIALSIFYKEALVIVPLATSTSDNSLGQSFIIYPNPTVDRIVLSVPVQECEDYGIEIINASGQSFIHGIKPFCLDDHKMVLTVENLPEGIYFVRINSSKFSGIARFVKTIK